MEKIKCKSQNCKIEKNFTDVNNSGGSRMMVTKEIWPVNLKIKEQKLLVFQTEFSETKSQLKYLQRCEEIS